jgi:spore cortex protein
MKYIKNLSFILLLIAFSAGCTMNNGAREDVRDRDKAEIQTYDNDLNNDGVRIQNNDNNQNDNQLRFGDEAKAKVEDLDEVKTAHIIMTDRAAYVAVVLKDDETGNVRKDLENKISDRVKSTDSDIQNVYVSSNPDFVDRMSDYGDKIQNGKPIRGLFDEFSEMVQRVFPTAR